MTVWENAFMSILSKHEIRVDVCILLVYKCEICSNLANTNDPIDNLPPGWIALVQKAPFLSFVSRKDLHFCSWQCLYTWTREQEARSVVEERTNV